MFFFKQINTPSNIVINGDASEEVKKLLNEITDEFNLQTQKALIMEKEFITALKDLLHQELNLEIEKLNGAEYQLIKKQIQIISMLPEETSKVTLNIIKLLTFLLTFRTIKGKMTEIIKQNAFKFGEHQKRYQLFKRLYDSIQQVKVLINDNLKTEIKEDFVDYLKNIEELLDLQFQIMLKLIATEKLIKKTYELFYNNFPEKHLMKIDLQDISENQRYYLDIMERNYEKL